MGSVIVGVVVFVGILLIRPSETTLAILAVVIVGSLLLMSLSMDKMHKDIEKAYQIMKKNINDKINSLTDFTVNQVTLGDFIIPGSGIAFDKNRKKICLIKWGNEGIDLNIISTRDILSSEIFMDGVSITKTDRSSQLGGALIGGLAFGGVGAIIGGLSGSTVSSTNIKDAILRLVINRTSNPIYDINFLHVNANTEDNSDEYINAMQEIRHWQALMEVVIKHADLEDNKKIDDNKKEVSIADELKKLAALKNEGILSEEEFLAEKTKLLN